MAWDDVLDYAGPNMECHTLEAVLAADVLYDLAHSLGKQPIVVTFTSLNQVAATAGFWVSAESTTEIRIQKPNGAPGAQIRVHIWTLRHPH